MRGWNSLLPLLRILATYSMVWVLLGLCVFFSMMTIRMQQPTPREALEQLWGDGAPTQWGTVVVASGSNEDYSFAS